MDTKKIIGYQGESLAQSYYENLGYTCREKNFTIRGGEIDLIMEDEHTVVIAEVKVVNYVDNLHDYITPKKLFALRRSIETYFWKYPVTKQVRVDVIFIYHDRIIEHIKGIEFA